jgi:hypothetical protein
VHHYQFSREIQLLLVDQSDQKVELQYNFNKSPFKMPLIGPRPPYYCNPRYEQYYPVI